MREQGDDTDHRKNWKRKHCQKECGENSNEITGKYVFKKLRRGVTIDTSGSKQDQNRIVVAAQQTAVTDYEQERTSQDGW